jgi:hypothetical protein
LQSTGQGVRHVSAEGPTEQVVGPFRLNLSNGFQVVLDNRCQGLGEWPLSAR